MAQSLGRYVDLAKEPVSKIKSFVTRAAVREDKQPQLNQDQLNSQNDDDDDSSFIVINLKAACTQTDESSSDPHRHPLPLSTVQIRYLDDQPLAAASILRKLKAEGFACKFDFQACTVDIRILRGNSPDDALQIIKDSMVEMNFPAEPMARMEDKVDSISSQGTDKVKALVVKVGSVVKLVGLVEDMKQFGESLRSSMEEVDPEAFAPENMKEGSMPMIGAAAAAEEMKKVLISMSESCFRYLCAYKWTELKALVGQLGVELTKHGDCEMKLEGPVSGVDKAAKILDDKKGEVKVSKIKLNPKINEAVVDQAAEEIRSKYQCDVTKKKGFGGPSMSSPAAIDPQFQSLVSLTVYGLKEIRVKVVVHSLENQKAHVIVNTTNTELELNRGKGVSWCILQDAGTCIQTELSQKYPNGIKYDEVAESGPGDLKTCRTIYHGALPPFPKGDDRSDNYKTQEGECFKWMVTLVFNCLIKASSSDKGYINIAFPALGTGNLEYPAQHVVQLMYKAIKLFKDLKRPGSLKEIIIVVYPETDITVKQMFLAHRQTDKLQTRHVGSLEQMREEYSKDEEEEQDIQKCEIRVIIGSTLLQVVDCNIHDACNVSEAILLLWSDQEKNNPDTYPGLKCMDPFKEDWKCSSYVSELNEHKCTADIMNLKRRTLIHCYSKDYTERQITDGIIRGLKKAVERKCNTVTIPIVSDGHLAKKPRNSAQIIINAVSKAKANIYVVTVAIEDSATFENFASMVDEFFKSKLHAPADIDKSSVADEIWQKTHAEKASESHSSLQSVVTVTNEDCMVVITSDSDENNQEATKKFIKRLRQKLPDVIEEEIVS